MSAWNLFKGKGPVIAVDFGTALTLTVADSGGTIRGVTISPGLGTAIKALATNAAQLPFVSLEAPSSSLGMNTETAIQAASDSAIQVTIAGGLTNIKADDTKYKDKTYNTNVVEIGDTTYFAVPFAAANTNNAKANAGTYTVTIVNNTKGIV